MREIVVRLAAETDGGVGVSGGRDGAGWQHRASAEQVRAVRSSAAALTGGFESGHPPLADPVALGELGRTLRDTFLPPLYAAGTDFPAQGEGRVLFVSAAPGLLNLPWELLPGRDGQFLVADARWSLRRATRPDLPPAAAPQVARPLRVLFAACAPLDQRGLDYEREEEHILRLADRLGGQVHLEIAEAGTFDELRELISELHPHVVHLSGHGSLRDGVGHFAFENDRGQSDLRDAREMAELLFAGQGVRLVFFSGCQTAQAGAAGLCQTLTATGHVPLALGWGASIADRWATEFVRIFYHELAAGQPVDRAVAVARRELLAQCRVRLAGADLLDASFALPQVYAAEAVEALVDEQLASDPPRRPGVRYELLGDNIRGLREGFVGRRRLLQRTRPALRAGEAHVLLLTGIGGGGKSTLATRLANRFQQDGYRVVAVQARRPEAPLFCLRLVTELATACQRLGREADERMLRDGQRPLADRLRLAVEVLNEARILLVLDNLEALLPPPPAPATWTDPDFAAFVHELALRLTGAGRAILTCRYVPEDWNAEPRVGRGSPDVSAGRGSPDPAPPPTAGLPPSPETFGRPVWLGRETGHNLGRETGHNVGNVLHEALPDFSEADFFKYLRRHDRVARRMERGELSRELLQQFHRTLGGTPRFVEQASAVLGRIDPDQLRQQLDALAEPPEEGDPDEIRRLQQDYFRDLFLPQLYDALPAEYQRALSRLAVVDLPLPLDGVAAVGGLEASAAAAGADAWLGWSLVQRFGESDEVPLYAVYPLQREYLTHPDRLDPPEATAAHGAAAAFFQDCRQQDREAELRLAIGDELFACLGHATAAGDADRRRWATVKLCWRLIPRAEYAAAAALVEPLLDADRHPDLLQIAARIALDTGDWKTARQLTGEAQEQRQALGDRAGEAATWHQLASIDLNEGQYAAAREKFGRALAIFQAIGDRAGEAATWHNLASIDAYEGQYAAAREKFGRALAMRQAIGDRAGEAATWHQLATIDLNEGQYAAAREKFGRELAMCQALGDRAGEAMTLYQIGFVAWKNGRRAVAIRLVAMATGLLALIGAVEQRHAMQNLAAMAGELGLDQKGFEDAVREGGEQYQADRGAALVQAAFEGL